MEQFAQNKKSDKKKPNIISVQYVNNFLKDSVNIFIFNIWYVLSYKNHKGIVKILVNTMNRN